MVDVAIIGAGPAGLAAAIALKARGVAEVVVLEREAEAGGVPRHCAHYPFGLREFFRLMKGPDYARALVQKAEAAGAEIRRGTSVRALGPDGRIDYFSAAGPGTLDARRVLIATGARETPRAARLIGGDRPAGVLNTGALQAYLNLENFAPFRRPLLVGTELVGLSALATCRAQGIRPVAMIEPGPRAVARFAFGLYPRLCGIPMHYRTELVEIRGRGQVESVALRGPSGVFELGCDGVVLTGRFLPEGHLVRASHLAFDPATGGPVVDQFGRCSDPAYFAAGNLLRAVETAGWCFREGEKIGDHVADDLQGRLVPPVQEIEILAGPGLAYVMPQRLDEAALAEAVLQLRASAPCRGRLRLHAGGTDLLVRKIATRPERRILVPLQGLALPPGTRRIDVEIVA